MIKFNNFPPERAGDAELTQEAKVSISRATRLPNSSLSQRDNRIRLHAYGQAVAHTLIAATDKPGIFVELATPILKEIEAEAEVNKVDFRAGLLSAQTAVEQTKEQGAKV